MYHTTGLTKARITELCARIEERGIKPGMRPWPPILGLRNALTVTLTYLRRNRVQEEIAEDYGVSQPTISRAISAITPILVQVLLECVPAADELDDGRQFKVLVACTLEGHLSWISDPVPGKRHDNYCLGESQVLEDADPLDWIGDNGFIGNGMITPFRKPAGGELLDWQKEFNTQVNKIRWVIEQVIANLKTWRIMHTDYRRPVETFTTTISAVIGLHFYRMA